MEQQIKRLLSTIVHPESGRNIIESGIVEHVDLQNNRITVIRPKKGLSLPSLKELAEYKDLILLFAGRDLSVKYRQTVLGPLWLVIMPVISALVSTFVFGGIARIDSSGLPYFVFYFAARVL